MELLDRGTTIQPVVNRRIDNAEIDAKQEALNEPQCYRAEADPAEPWQYELQELVHVHQLWQQQPPQDADHKGHSESQAKSQAHSLYA